MNDILNVAEMVESSSIYGPGQRFVIWLQGCSRRCPGCWNVAMLPDTPRHLMKVDELLTEVVHTDGIEGITLLGGEPLNQSGPLEELVRNVKENGFTVMLYTGYEKDEIKETASLNIINLSDIIVYGRYLEDERSEDLRWRGSLNQEIFFNNIDYKIKYSQGLEENQTEIHISEEGEIVLVGYPDKELRAEVLR